MINLFLNDLKNQIYNNLIYMEVFYCNINKFNEDIESFVIAKNKIESNLRMLNKLDKKMTVNEFLEYVSNFNNNFINKSSSIISFNIYDLINGDKIIIYSGLDNDFEKEFLEKIKEIDFDITKLNKISFTQLLENPINDSYFSINDEIYI